MSTMPAEWEPHYATWLSWPKNPETFFDFESVEDAYVTAIKELVKGEKVFLLVDDEETKKKVLEKTGTHKNLSIKIIPTVDVWIRDYGPTFLTKTVAVKWTFNAWGMKYADLAEDNTVPYKMQNSEKIELKEAGIVLEGGSIDVNGKGTLITTEQCLLNKNRNPSRSRKQIEEKLKQMLGIERIVWLNEGIVGDDTDGHVDDIARFVNENTVVAAFEEDKEDENYKALKENFEILKQAGFKVIKMPMPDAIFLEDDRVVTQSKVSEVQKFEPRRLPASYCNVYIANACVLLPVFGQEKDKKAIKILQKFFPGRKIVPIESKSFVVGLGAIHCASQQQPLKEE